MYKRDDGKPHHQLERPGKKSGRGRGEWGGGPSKKKWDGRGADRVVTRTVGLLLATRHGWATLRDVVLAAIAQADVSSADGPISAGPQVTHLYCGMDGRIVPDDVITMSHRNVKPHVSIKWQATDSRGHRWGAPTPLLRGSVHPISVLESAKNEVDGGSLSRTLGSETATSACN